MNLLLGLAALLAASDDFPAKVKGRAALATVRVVAPDGTTGSGVLVKRSGPHAYVLTAAHVAGAGKNLEVHFNPAARKRVYRAVEVLARSAEADVAVLRLTTSDELPAPLAVCPPEGVPKRPPASAASGGWAGDAPTVLTESVLRKVLLRRPGEDKSSWCWQTKRTPDKGRSGGPLVDDAGRVIGLATGHDGSAGYYTHAEEIHRVLKRNGLGWLFADEER